MAYKKLSDYSAQDMKKVFQKPKRMKCNEKIIFYRKNPGISMLLNKVNSEISFRNRIIGKRI